MGESFKLRGKHSNSDYYQQFLLGGLMLVLSLQKHFKSVTGLVGKSHENDQGHIAKIQILVFTGPLFSTVRFTE